MKVPPDTISIVARMDVRGGVASGRKRRAQNAAIARGSVHLGAHRSNRSPGTVHIACDSLMALPSSVRSIGGDSCWRETPGSVNPRVEWPLTMQGVDTKAAAISEARVSRSAPDRVSPSSALDASCR